MFAMGIGAAALVIVLSVFNGFEDIAVSLYESFQPHLKIVPKENKDFNIDESTIYKLSKLSDISSFSKIYESKAYFKYLDKESIGILKGVDQNYFKTNNIKSYLIHGDTIMEDESTSYSLIGIALNDKLNINYHDNFESLSVYVPKVNSNAGIGITNVFEVSYLTPRSVFSIYQEFDEKYVIAPLSFVQYLNNKDDFSITSIEIKVKNSNRIDAVRKQIQEILPINLKIVDRLESNETLYRITKIEKLITFLIMSFILIVLSLNFIGSLSMHVIEKRNDLLILRNIGFRSIDIQKLYIFIGSIQGLLGGFLGLILGILICFMQKQFGLIKMPGNGTFVVSEYPVLVKYEDIIFIMLLLFCISIIISVFPAFKAKESIKEFEI